MLLSYKDKNDHEVFGIISRSTSEAAVRENQAGTFCQDEEGKGKCEKRNAHFYTDYS